MNEQAIIEEIQNLLKQLNECEAGGDAGMNSAKKVERELLDRQLEQALESYMNLKASRQKKPEFPPLRIEVFNR